MNLIVLTMNLHHPPPPPSSPPSPEPPPVQIFCDHSTISWTAAPASPSMKPYSLLLRFSLDLNQPLQSSLNYKPSKSSLEWPDLEPDSLDSTTPVNDLKSKILLSPSSSPCAPIEIIWLLKAAGPSTTKSFLSPWSWCYVLWTDDGTMCTMETLLISPKGSTLVVQPYQRSSLSH